MKKNSSKIQKTVVVILLLMSFNSLIYSQNDSIATDKLRTESGVDPTRVNSRVGYSVLYYNQKANREQITNRVNLTLGVNRWSFAIKPEFTSIHNGVPGTGFQSGMGDFKFSILNAFYVKGSNALAASVEFGLPFAKPGLGLPYFTATPSITFSHTFTPSLFLAVQPQYTFNIANDATYPNISVLTARMFIAKFTKTGYFFVFEPRPIYNFENKNFDLIISPIIGKALGAGFNLITLLEIPVKQEATGAPNQGVLFQFGFNKNF